MRHFTTSTMICILFVFCSWMTMVRTHEICPRNDFYFHTSGGRKMSGYSVAYTSHGTNTHFSIDITSTPQLKKRTKAAQAAQYMKKPAAKLFRSRGDQPYCTKTYFSATTEIPQKKAKKTEIVEEKEAGCCLRPLQKTEEDPFPILPHVLTKAVQKMEKLIINVKPKALTIKEMNTEVWEEVFDRYQKAFTWFVYEFKEITYYILGRLKVSKVFAKTHCGLFVERMKLFSALKKLKIPGKPLYEKPYRKCYSIPTSIDIPEGFVGEECWPSIERCHTKNVLSVTMFILVPKEKEDRYELMEFRMAYSADGVFDATKVFSQSSLFQPGWFKKDEVEVYWMTMSDFWNNGGFNQKYQLDVAPRWRRRQFCGSCPGQGVAAGTTITYTQEQVNSVSNVYSVSGKLSGTIAEAVTVTASASYTYSFAKSIKHQMSTGHTMSLKIDCNALYVYEFNLDIKLFTQKLETVPTQYYYCTDRDTPPKCVPRVDIDPTKPKPEDDDHTLYCNGYDGKHDWEGVADDKQWTTKHAGRPQGMKLTNFEVGDTILPFQIDNNADNRLTTGLNKLREQEKQPKEEVKQQEVANVDQQDIEAHVVEGDMYDEFNRNSHDDKAQKIVYYRNDGMNDGMNGSMNGSMNVMYLYIETMAIIVIIAIAACCLVCGAGSFFVLTKFKPSLKAEISGSNTTNDHIL